MAVINLTKKEASMILAKGKPRAEGVVIKVDALLEILQKSPMTSERLFELLDHDVALSMTKGDAADPGDHIAFSKPALERISQGIDVKRVT